MRVTGVLIYHDGRFLQTVEGPPAKIEAVYKRIAEDRRHTDIEILIDASVSRRLFPDWVMALNAELGTSLLLRILRALIERPLSGTADDQRRMVEHMIAELVRQTSGRSNRGLHCKLSGTVAMNVSNLQELEKAAQVSAS